MIARIMWLRLEIWHVEHMPPILKRANSGFKVVGKQNNLLIHMKAHTVTAFTTTLCRHCVKNAGGGQAAAGGWLEGCH
jgi:hypothetical protein